MHCSSASNQYWRKELDGAQMRPLTPPGYGEFGELRAHLDRFSNPHPVGRNGMHCNQDHSMLAANSAAGMKRVAPSKQETWHTNGEDSYHEDWQAHLKSRLRSRHQGCASRAVV
jgi:hypothetical protein